MDCFFFSLQDLILGGTLPITTKQKRLQFQVNLKTMRKCETLTSTFTDILMTSSWGAKFHMAWANIHQCNFQLVLTFEAKGVSPSPVHTFQVVVLFTMRATYYWKRKGQTTSFGLGDIATTANDAVLGNAVEGKDSEGDWHQRCNGNLCC